ncbi:Hypothetical predicted protein, partial [Cloeon dipterum]
YRALAFLISYSTPWRQQGAAAGSENTRFEASIRITPRKMRSILVFCVFLLALQQGLALKCHLCGASPSNSCPDPFNKDLATTCDLPNGRCVKLGVKGIHTRRTCLPVGVTCDDLMNQINMEIPSGNELECKICDSGDFCNAAPRFTATWIALFVGAAAFILSQFY